LITVASGAICMRLGIDKRQLTRWEYKGYLRGHREEYELSELNAFLAKYVRNAEPTWEHLLHSADVMLSAERARAQLHISESLFEKLMGSHPIAYARFPGKTYRYSLVGLWQALPLMADQVPLWLAARALVCSEKEATQLLGAAAGPSLVVRQSLLRALRLQLPAWVDPEDWLYDCEVEHPLTVARAAELLCMSESQLYGTLHEERAPYIVRENTLRKKRVWVSPLWVWAYFTREQPLTDQQVARLLGVTSQAANVWKKNAKAICGIPDHAHDTHQPHLWPMCWVEYLRNNCSPTFRGGMYAFSLGQLAGASPLPVYSTGQAQKDLGMTSRQINRLVAADKVLVLRTPGGEYRIVPDWQR